MSPGEALKATAEWIIPYFPHVYGILSLFWLWNVSRSAAYRRRLIVRAAVLTLFAVIYGIVWLANPMFHNWKQFGFLSSAIFALTVVAIVLVRYRQYSRLTESDSLHAASHS